MSQDISDLKQNNAEKDQVWDRPPVPSDYDADRDGLCFQAIEAEEGTLSGGQATVKLFGVTADGNSVLLHVRDFKHYLYVAAPVSFTAEDCSKFRAYLETQLAMHQPAIHSVVLTMRENIYGFQGNIQNPFIKITVTDPKFINRVRTTIERGDANWKGMWKSADGTIMTYDNIQYLLRFMVDCSVSRGPDRAPWRKGANIRYRLPAWLGLRHPLASMCSWPTSSPTARSRPTSATET
jgi:DNA polymerase delta subunit 1